MNLLKEETLAKKLITKWSLVYIFSFLIAPSGYFIRVLASNTLSVEEIWIFYSILGLIGILAAYNDLGLTEALQYFLPKYWIEKKYDHYKTIWVLTFIMQLLSWIIIWGWLWLGADWLAQHYFHASYATDILKLFSLYFLIINFFQAFWSVYTAFQDVLYEKIIEITRMYSVLGFTVVFWLTQSLDVTKLSYAWLGWLGLGLLLSLSLFIFKYLKTFKLGKIVLDRWLLKKQCSYAFRVFLGMNAGILLWQVDQQMIVVLLWPESAWYYANYLSLFNLYGIFIFPFTALLFPIATELISKKQKEKITLLLSILYKYFTVFWLFIGGILVALWPVIAWVLYGPNFIYSWTLISYAGIFVVLNIIIVINFGILAGMGKVRERVKIIAIALAINIVGNLILMLGFGWGLIGAIIATVLWWLTMVILTTQLVRKEYVFTMDWMFIIRNSIIVLLLSGWLRYAQYLFDRWQDISRFVRVGYLMILVGSYACVLLLFNYKSIVMLWKEIKSLGVQEQKTNV